MRLERIECPLMENYDVADGKKDIRLCDDYCWEIRKLFPENFQCCKNGKCLITELTKDSAEYEFICDFRESCILGDNCPGHNGGICTFKDEILPEKKQKKKTGIIPPTLEKKLAELLA